MRGFMPLVADVVKTSIQVRVDRMIDSLFAKGSFDFVADFAYPLPSLVIFDLLGIPEEDHATIRDTAKLFWLFPVAMYQQDLELLDRIANQALCAEGTLLRIMDQRRSNPQMDLISSLIRPTEGDESIPDDDIVVMCIFLLMAGHETTANLLSGALLHLLRERAHWDLLRSNPQILGSAVEELLRFISPVLWVARLVRKDVQVGGKWLRAGEEVRVSIGAANHDPTRFDHPERLDLTRTGSSSLAFGYGIHTCLGAALARMETNVALASLLRRAPGIRLLSDSVEYAPIYFFRALKSLPISIAS
ncbi:putative cytochrome P450 hydroxylase [Acidisarcina polymorpha]|uniref:Putative cytochrome P450 hydroxylase n=2 Tax=Acidisarcina polymorpha TaxID=2211140 RepID=A0A2Z5FV52_9BACT|nr:cytochrome P450 [Acidisarcina polymorpha]AXC10741.1 putative cytochrome P450 hydroxylase [Acidisarcina polymorpha]